MVMIPTFHFINGSCAEGIALYEKAFGLVVDWQGKHEDGHIYHTEAHIGSQKIRLSDNGGTEREKIQADSLFLAVVFDDAEEVNKAFDILKEGGTIIQLPHKPDYATYMSELKDKFGFKWFLMVN